MNKKVNESESESQEDDCLQSILDHVLNCPVVFQSQQIGDPDLTEEEKKRISKFILINKPLEFLMKFGKFLEEHHLKDYFLKKHEASIEVKYYVGKLMKSADERGKIRLIRNRRYEAMKRMEANGNYFSDAEMEKREPLLYHQMVGQYLNDSEKEKKQREAFENVSPTFSNFLLHKLEKEELRESLLAEQNEENEYDSNGRNSESSFTESSFTSAKNLSTCAKWGADWEDEENFIQMKSSDKNYKNQSKQLIGSQEKALLYEEFKSTMQNKFLNGQDNNVNYSDIDSNSDYDCIEIRAQDEEEKYFDEETSDKSYACTDTGIEDY